ncbi:hypothetical protein BpHYR1_037614 [Brachionus plicatilis]|uniref:Uncharacterized protein n=1 Tax=Brachionus plicatilis TaxID=10195 RepID=A0A3M7S0S2_BRAPC|nr:hypothetical protein BpHYR1_037614 [Brachionus plicatilis]
MEQFINQRGCLKLIIDAVKLSLTRLIVFDGIRKKKSINLKAQNSKPVDLMILSLTTKAVNEDTQLPIKYSLFIKTARSIIGNQGSW